MTSTLPNDNIRNFDDQITNKLISEIIRDRACTITLGSVNTPLWDSESINSDFDRTSMLSSSEVSDTILYMAQKPESQLIEDLTLMPSGGAF